MRGPTGSSGDPVAQSRQPDQHPLRGDPPENFGVREQLVGRHLQLTPSRPGSPDRQGQQAPRANSVKATPRRGRQSARAATVGDLPTKAHARTIGFSAAGNRANAVFIPVAAGSFASPGH
jgi:hypothetical protein